MVFVSKVLTFFLPFLQWTVFWQIRQEENFFFFSGVGTMPPPQTPARDWGGDTPPHTSACIVHPTLLDLVTPLCDSIVNMCWGILQFVYVQIISGSSINRLMKFAPYFAELE